MTKMRRRGRRNSNPFCFRSSLVAPLIRLIRLLHSPINHLPNIPTCLSSVERACSQTYPSFLLTLSPRRSHLRLLQLSSLSALCSILIFYLGFAAGAGYAGGAGCACSPAAGCYRRGC